MANADLTAERVRYLLHYEPETGLFMWRFKRSGIRRPPMTPFAGCLNGDGRLQIRVDYVKHFSHKLAWIYMTGEHPSYTIDHINGDCTDNRFANLRDVPISINCQNARRPTKQSQSGILGVTITRAGAYRARLHLDGETKWLGTFKTAEEAQEAYFEAKRKYHPGFCL